MSQSDWDTSAPFLGVKMSKALFQPNDWPQKTNTRQWKAIRLSVGGHKERTAAVDHRRGASPFALTAQRVQNLPPENVVGL